MFSYLLMVPKIFYSTEQLSSTIWFRLNRIKNWTKIWTFQISSTAKVSKFEKLFRKGPIKPVEAIDDSPQYQ